MPTPTRNVLVVDDDCGTRTLLVALLFSRGFHAIAAEDGLEALHMLRTVRRRAPEAACLVLLDLAMPRLGGSEFRRAQLNDPRVAAVPVAVMSGASDLRQRARALGAVAALGKPIDDALLLETVERYCVAEGLWLRPPADGLTNRRRKDGA